MPDQEFRLFGDEEQTIVVYRQESVDWIQQYCDERLIKTTHKYGQPIWNAAKSMITSRIIILHCDEATAFGVREQFNNRDKCQSH